MNLRKLNKAQFKLLQWLTTDAIPTHNKKCCEIEPCKNKARWHITSSLSGSIEICEFHREFILNV